MPGQTKKFMNQSEFAKALGVSQPMVAKYIREGHLDGAFKRRGRRTIIDYKKAVKLLSERLDPTKHGKVNAVAGLGDKLSTVTAAGIDLTNLTHAEASTLDRAYSAALKKQKLDKEAGRLIDKAESVAGYARVVVGTRTKFMAVASKVAPMINDAIDDPELAAEVIQLIDKLIREALNDLAAGEK